MPKTLVVAIALGMFFLAGLPARAATDGASKCKETKARATGRKVFNLLKAFAKNEKKPNASKLGQDISNARSKFANGFSKAEARGGCSTTGDSDDIEARADALVADVIAEVLRVTAPCSTVTFPDYNLDAAIRGAIGKASGPICDTDLLPLTELDASGRAIMDLSGIEHCSNLAGLSLWDNQISDISPLASMAALTSLTLAANQISDISPLAGLTALTSLVLAANQISDISPLTGLTALTSLTLVANQISDISPLAGLTALTVLDLRYNQISDITPLVDNSGIGAGDYVDLVGNALSSDSINISIPILISRGAGVEY